MPLEKIYVARHGFRSSWLVDAATGAYSAYLPSPTGIPADPALTAHGVDQARQLGSHLATLDPPVEAVYSSPFHRCLQTLEPFVQQQPAGSRAASIRPEHGLREWFGAAPFDHPEPAPTAVLKALFPAVDDEYASVASPSSRGETLAALQARVAAVVRAIVARCDADGSRAAVLCTHAAVVIVLGRVLTGRVPDSVDADDFHAYTCGLSVYRRARDGRPADADEGVVGGWHCELDSDCSFLSGGEERGWSFTGDEAFPGAAESLSQGEETGPKL